ncbi:unnamed protein product [Pedinophyceae sp. YPF-701]|nr:unnamed protein product [Pedinophyceae sp. YPF-701]
MAGNDVELGERFADMSNHDGPAKSTHFEQQFAKTMERTRVAAAVLQTVPKSRQVCVAFEDVNAFVSTMPFKPSLPAQAVTKATSMLTEKGRERAAAAAAAPTERQILTGVHGRVSPGEMMALMGPSGSGKTSLLSILGGRAAAAVRVEGRLQYNGAPLVKATKRTMGFVHQDDLLFDSLTVYETLHYAARLRLPRDMSNDEKELRVETVIQALGLDRCRNTIIGGPFMRGVSGGERKRVSIGHELLINPAGIFLDEPTSGLDATTALKLVHTLKVLAAGGRSVVTTIHQPASRIYQELDKVMVLSEGKVMYFGHGSLAHAWFNSLGYAMPLGVNTADFLLDLASGDVGATQQEARELSSQLCAAYERFMKGGAVEPRDLSDVAKHSSAEIAKLDGPAASAHEVRQRQMMGVQHRHVAVLRALQGGGSHDGDDAARPAHADDDSMGQSNSTDLSDKATLAAHSAHDTSKVDVELGKGEHAHSTRWGASFMDQILILTRRSLKTRRFEALGFQKFLQFAVVGVLTGLFWFRQGGGTTAKDVNNTVGLLFFEMIFMSFAALFAALFTFPAEYQMLLKERASGMYRLSAFYLARSFSDLPLDCLYPSVFVFIIYWMSGLKATAAAFFGNWFTIILTVLVGQSMGMLIGTVMMNPKSGQTVATIAMLTFMLTAGFYIDDIPVWIEWVKYLGFPYFSWRMLMKLEFGDYDGEYPERLTRPNEISFGLDMGCMFLFLFGLRFITYMELRRKTKNV